MVFIIDRIIFIKILFLFDKLISETLKCQAMLKLPLTLCLLLTITLTKKMWQSVVFFVVVYGFYERVQMNGKELENKTICNYELVLTTFLDKKG